MSAASKKPAKKNAKTTAQAPRFDTRWALWGVVIVLLVVVAFLVMRPAGGGSGSAPTGVQDVDNTAFKAAIAAGYQLIDVRTPQEYAQGHIPGAVNIPIESLPQALSQIDKSKPVAVYCATGARSLNAKQFLAAQGYQTVINLQQGIVAWDGPTVSGTQPGSSASVGGTQGAAAVKTTAVKTTGKPVFIDLFSPA